MGKSRYKNIQELLKPIVGKTLHINKLWRRIMINVGSDDRTIRDYMKTMRSLGLILEVKDNYYKINSYEAEI